MAEDIGRKNALQRVFGAVSLIALGTAVAVGIGLPVLGIFTGGTLRADFAIALIVISVIVDVAVLSSYAASVRIQHIVRVAWLTVAVMSLAFSQYILGLGYSDSPRAADSVLGIVMYLLAFPAGNIGVGFLMILDGLFPSHASSDWWDLVIYWTVFVTAGYLQWFKVLPWLIQKYRAYRMSEA